MLCHHFLLRARALRRLRRAARFFAVMILRMIHSVDRHFAQRYFKRAQRRDHLVDILTDIYRNTDSAQSIVHKELSFSRFLADLLQLESDRTAIPTPDEDIGETRFEAAGLEPRRSGDRQ